MKKRLFILFLGFIFLAMPTKAVEIGTNQSDFAKEVKSIEEFVIKTSENLEEKIEEKIQQTSLKNEKKLEEIKLNDALENKVEDGVLKFPDLDRSKNYSKISWITDCRRLLQREVLKLPEVKKMTNERRFSGENMHCYIIFDITFDKEMKAKEVTVKKSYNFTKEAQKEVMDLVNNLTFPKVPLDIRLDENEAVELIVDLYNNQAPTNKFNRYNNLNNNRKF